MTPARGSASSRAARTSSLRYRRGRARAGSRRPGGPMRSAASTSGSGCSCATLDPLRDGGLRAVGCCRQPPVGEVAGHRLRARRGRCRPIWLRSSSCFASCRRGIPSAVAPMPDVATRHDASEGTRDVTADSVTITVPVDGYEKVVRLVSAGLASRLGFGFETVDDLQLAIELVLRSVPSRGGSATVRMASDGRTLSIAIAPVDGLTLEQSLQPIDGAGVGLGASLEQLVDA